MAGSPIDAVVFDFDGTIIDTELSEFETIAAEFARLGLDYPIDDFRQRVGRADHPHWTDVLQSITGPLPNIDDIVARRSADRLRRIAESPLRPGVLETIERATEAGLKLAVATSSPLSWAAPLLEQRGLIDHFPVIATRDIVENAKPWPDVFLAAANKLDVAPQRCLVIEDSFNGVQAAKAAGMICIAVPNPITAPSDFSAADLRIETLADLPWAEYGLGGP